MLSREQQKLLNIEFWNEFRKFMNNQKSSNGKRINWLNYPSDVKNIYIRLQADGKGARLCFDIQPKDDDIRSIIWEQMTELKKVMENNMTHETIWLEKLWNDEGRVFSRIMWQQEGLDFYLLKDRELIFVFLKNRLIEFDAFYQEFKEILISLTD
ncbi:MAG: hypothetical protein RI883_74 [Bacteroidota bacterium]|jgi:hypothetical protein